MAKTVFTNGCFDIIHAGHIDLLRRARELGDRLVVGINSDRSVRMIKGGGRPFIDQRSRQEILQAIRYVDDVIIFDESTPAELIRQIQPDVLVKGGDWKVEEIVGAESVLARGGSVHSLELKGGYSSSAIVESVRNGVSESNGGQKSGLASLEEHISVFNRIDSECGDAISNAAKLIFDTFSRDNKLLICGNGGSAADAQHLAAEFVGRYEGERRALPAIALTTDTSALTALANDYSFDRVFARQVEALAQKGDCLIAISTSGNSPNIIAAVIAARNAGCSVIGMTGGKGKKLAGLCDICVMIPSDRTARIQEGHITVAHLWCESVDKEFAASS